MNLRSIKKRNQPRLKRSAGRGWSLAAMALPVYLTHIKEYNDWFNAQLCKAFGRCFIESAPGPDVLAHFEKLMDVELTKGFDTLGISQEHL